MLVNFNPAMSVRFRGQEEKTVPDDLFSRPGAYTRTDVQENTPKTDTNKKSNTQKKVLWTIAGLVALAAVAVALPKVFPKVFADKNTADLKGIKKYLQKGANGIKKFSDYVIGKFDSLIKMIKGKKSDMVPAENPEVIPPKNPTHIDDTNAVDVVDDLAQ